MLMGALNMLTHTSKDIWLLRQKPVVMEFLFKQHQVECKTVLRELLLQRDTSEVVKGININVMLDIRCNRKSKSSGPREDIQISSNLHYAFLIYKESQQNVQIIYVLIKY